MDNIQFDDLAGKRILLSNKMVGYARDVRVIEVSPSKRWILVHDRLRDKEEWLMFSAIQIHEILG